MTRAEDAPAPVIGSPHGSVSESAGRRLHIIGAGLIGTSVGLAAVASGWQVTVEDADFVRAERARERLGALHPVDQTMDSPCSEVDIVCVAVPPAAVGETLSAAARIYLSATLIDVASVKAQPQQQIERLSPALDRYVPTHPLGGGEGSGPDAARSDLFRGRSWVLCADPARPTARTAAVVALIQACGAHPVWLSAPEHDRLLAVTSHLPQLLASALAAEVEQAFGTSTAVPTEGGARDERSRSLPSGDAGSGWDAASRDGVPSHDPLVVSLRPPTPAAVLGRPNPTSVPASSLAGPALWDMTRIASSPSELWAQVARLNHADVRRALRSLLDRLEAVEAGMVGPAEAAAEVAALVDAGRSARARLGRKHRSASEDADGRTASAWTWVDIAIDDTPGTLARVFATASRLGVNVEDVRVDHAPYASQGTVSVAVADAEEAARLQATLRGLARDDVEPTGLVRSPRSDDTWS